jgi:hypothetical protein
MEIMQLGVDENSLTTKLRPRNQECVARAQNHEFVIGFVSRFVPKDLHTLLQSTPARGGAIVLNYCFSDGVNLRAKITQRCTKLGLDSQLFHAA